MKKRGELTLETVAIYIILLAFAVIVIFMVMRNQDIMNRLLSVFSRI